MYICGNPSAPLKEKNFETSAIAVLLELLLFIINYLNDERQSGNKFASVNRNFSSVLYGKLLND